MSGTQVSIHKDPTVFGFWIYVLSDCVIFASLFATYAVLHSATALGAGARELFSPPFALLETLILLTSSFTGGLAMLTARHERMREFFTWSIVTFSLGALFVGLEINEFSRFIAEGHGPDSSAFLSSFFTLVGTHGMHVIAGLLWLVVLAVQTVIWGITHVTLRRLTLWSIFWHFLDIVWIFIFTIVYLLPMV